MLPGLGFTEIVALAVIALLVVGPKDLPLMLRKLGRMTARLRGMAHEFRSGFDELARQAELDELRREVNSLRRATSPSSMLDAWSRPIETDHEPVYAPDDPPPPEEAAAALETSAAAEPLEPPFEAPPKP